MHPNLCALLVLIAVTGASATVHTMCWNHFNATDGCVNGNAGDDRRCGAPKKRTSGVAAFTSPSTPKVKRSGAGVLWKRYNTADNIPSLIKDQGQGVCDPDTYPPPKDGQIACLWIGNSTDKDAPEGWAGWLNHKKPVNCGKKLWLQRTGDKQNPQAAIVHDGCKFNTNEVKIGCFAIALSPELFAKFNPTPDEVKNGVLATKLDWDFDNSKGDNSAWGPV